MHAHFPFVAMWDDHEFANDCWQDHATDFDDLYGDEAEPDRRGAATRAFCEYVPVRQPYDAAANHVRLYRNVRSGTHVALEMAQLGVDLSGFAQLPAPFRQRYYF